MAGIYIHVPFCIKRCIYCDFYSNTDMSYKAAYIEAVCRELELKKDVTGDEVIRTVYFGGGTPSQLDAKDFSRIFDKIESLYTFASRPEITLEANPDDLTLPYIQDLSGLPFNRVSLGIQSFREEDLVFLNRRHTAEQAARSVKELQQHGFSNISIDLIYGLPGSDLRSWEENLKTALSLNVQHISAYHLTYEEGTTLHRRVSNKEILPVDEEESIRQFEYLIGFLKSNGYEQYEISNFALPGFHSRHNSSYWKGEKYLGVGPSAHSYNAVERHWNISSLPLYLKGIASGRPAMEVELSDARTCYNDYVITRLRTIWGIDLNEIKLRFGEDYRDYCLRQAHKHIRQNLIKQTDNTLILTKEGIFISDSVMSDLLSV